MALINPYAFGFQPKAGGMYGATPQPKAQQPMPAIGGMFGATPQPKPQQPMQPQQKQMPQAFGPMIMPNQQYESKPQFQPQMPNQPQAFGMPPQQALTPAQKYAGAMNQQQAYDYNRSGESNKNGRQLEAMAQQAMPQLGSMFGMPPQQAQQMWNQEAKNRAAPAAPVRPVAPKPAPAPVRRNTF